jgi:hypothetical protein
MNSRSRFLCEDDDKKTKTVAFLETPPVDSPESAIKVAIAAKARQQT